MNELQPRRRRTEEVAADIHTDGAGRTLADQLSELASVTATEIEHRESGDIAQKDPLSWPLDESI